MRHGTTLRSAIWTLAFGLLAGMWLAAACPARASVPCWDPRRRSRLDRSVYPPGYQGTWSLSNRGLLAASDGTLYAAYGRGSLYLSIVTPGPTGQEAEVRTLVADGGWWNEGDSRFPCPVEGPDGRVHLFFLARPAGWSGAGGCALQHLTYDPATGALAGPETVDYGRWGEYKRPLGPGLAAAVAPDGTLHLAYRGEDGTFCYAWRDAEGWHRERPFPWSEVRLSTTGQMAIALGPDGTVHLAFYNAAPQRPVLTHAWRTAEGSFQREAVYTSGPQDCPGIRGEVVDMAVDAQGHLHLAFGAQLEEDCSSPRWAVMYATDASGSWQVEQIAPGYNPSLQLEGGAPVVALFQTRDQAGANRLCVARRAGNGWQLEVAHDFGWNSWNLAVDLCLRASGGQEVLLYAVGRAYEPEERPRLLRRPAGGGWQELAALWPRGGNLGPPSTAADEQGRSWVAYHKWCQVSGVGRYHWIVCARRDAEGVWWMEEVAGAFTEGWTAPLGRPNVALGPDGTPWLLYRRGTGPLYEFPLLRRAPDGTWQEVSVAQLTDGETYHHLEVRLLSRHRYFTVGADGVPSFVVATKTQHLQEAGNEWVTTYDLWLYRYEGGRWHDQLVAQFPYDTPPRSYDYAELGGQRYVAVVLSSYEARVLCDAGGWHEEYARQLGGSSRALLGPGPAAAFGGRYGYDYGEVWYLTRGADGTWQEEDARPCTCQKGCGEADCDNGQDDDGDGLVDEQEHCLGCDCGQRLIPPGAPVDLTLLDGVPALLFSCEGWVWWRGQDGVWRRARCGLYLGGVDAELRWAAGGDIVGTSTGGGGCLGLAPRVQPGPRAFAGPLGYGFGNLEVGERADHYFAVDRLVTCPMVYVDYNEVDDYEPLGVELELGGEDPEDFLLVNPPSSCDRGCTFTVRFQPQSFGPKRATLYVHSRDPERQEPIAIELRGFACQGDHPPQAPTSPLFPPDGGGAPRSTWLCFPAPTDPDLPDDELSCLVYLKRGSSSFTDEDLWCCPDTVQCEDGQCRCWAGGLEPGATYWWKVVVQDACGQRDESPAFCFTVSACSGDLDGDGDVDGSDLAAFAACYGAAEPCADLNGDGQVTADDLAAFAGQLGGDECL